jgi:hypothetical protein
MMAATISKNPRISATVSQDIFGEWATGLGKPGGMGAALAGRNSKESFLS